MNGLFHVLGIVALVILGINAVILIVCGSIYWYEHRTDCGYSDPDNRIGHDGEDPEWK
jgi:hypothetical protein